MNINVLEFSQVVISVIAFIAWARADGLCLTDRNMHVFTDNLSGHSKIRKSRATHPFHFLLLQVMSLLMVQHGIFFTVGLISGRLSIIADAIFQWLFLTD
jgi:hypothetical protein